MIVLYLRRVFKDTCVILFSRSPEEESRFKRLHRLKQRNILIHKKLRNRSIQIVQASKLAYQVIDETKQSGGQFSDKITSTITQAFQSFKHVIVVGSDCPELSVSDITQAAQSLSDAKQVIGLEQKGGAFLIGLRKLDWNPEEFANLAWNTKQLGAQLLHWMKCQSDVCVLDSKHDINQTSDLYFTSFRADVKRLILILQNILEVYPIAISRQEQGHRVVWYTTGVQFRGPPVL